MTLSHPHLLHRHGQRRRSGKLMVTVFVAASHLLRGADRDHDRDRVVTDPYER